MHIILDSLAFIVTVVAGNANLARIVSHPTPPANEMGAQPLGDSSQAITNLDGAIADMRAKFATIMTRLDRIERKVAA